MSFQTLHKPRGFQTKVQTLFKFLLDLKSERVHRVGAEYLDIPGKKA